MFKKLDKKQRELRKLIVIYIIMAASVVVIVSFIIMIVLGFGYDANKGQLEQYSFLHFGSNPSGATVSINDQVLGSKTPNKTSVSAGKYTMTLKKDGYETWQKSINTQAGVIYWLNYALLVPKNLKNESIATYDSAYSSLASSDNRKILVQEKVDSPTFDLADISSETVKNTKLIIPAELYSESSTSGISHSFQVDKWDQAGRYVLIKHNYGEKSEWLVLDTQDVVATKNITKVFNISINSINFFDNSGNKFYALESNDIRKLDLSAGTISKPLVSNVKSFNVSDLNVITFVSNAIEGKDQQVAGIYLENSDKSYNLRTTVASANLQIATARYFKEDYVVISEGSKVDIFGGNYPNTNSKDASSLSVVKSFNLPKSVSQLGFSPSGEYILARTDDLVASYDLEYNNLYSSAVSGLTAGSSVDWLDNNYLWTNINGNLMIREFDGTNAHKISTVLSGQDAVLTRDENYIYSFDKSGEKVQLQRVKMILP